MGRIQDGEESKYQCKLKVFLYIADKMSVKIKKKNFQKKKKKSFYFFKAYMRAINRTIKDYLT